MSKLKIKDQNGKWVEITGVKGEKGDNGQDYILTENDKQEIAGLVDVPVDDVQINGTSIVNNNVANIPIASPNNAGVVKINPSFGVGLVNDVLIINGANSNDIKSANNSTKAISTLRQHEATFYGLAKASGDTTQTQSNNEIGTYTDEAKTAIQSMLGIPSTGYGLFVNSSDRVCVNKATSSSIKSSDAQYTPIVPSNQHESVFYGLAKASGDTTQAQSSNAVGTYTNEAKTNIQSMLGIDMDSKVDKTAIENAGITNKTYTTKFGGEFSVTTVEDSDYISSYARATVTGRIYKEYMHRVIFNNVEYILPARLWYEQTSSSIKVYEYLGNLSLYVSDVSGVIGGINDVPFIIISDLDGNGSIDVLTTEPGVYTIKVEQINNTQKQLPKSLIYGSNYAPIEQFDNEISTYNGFSIGVNELKNSRGVFGIGYANKIQSSFSYAMGIGNSVNQNNSFVCGTGNVANKPLSFIIGRNSLGGGSSSIAIGNGIYTNAENMIAIGSYNALAQYNYIDWQPNTTYHKGDIVKVTYDNKTYLVLCTIDEYTSGNEFEPESSWRGIPSNKDTCLAVGNGYNSDSRSNALKIDWVGNAYLGGNVYVDCDSNSTGGTKLVKESDLEDYAKTDDVVTDVQINGTSIINNGVADIPIASSSEKGVVGIDQTNGITITTSSGNLIINPAMLSSVKAGTNTRYPIVPAHVHEAAFYGLAKAAGDTTQSASANEVGTYTDEAKTAIKQMLDIKDDYDSLVIEVSGTDPVITGKPSYRYNCGELYTLTVTPPSSGTIDIIFTSGATPTVLDLPNTVKMPDWWAGIETNTTYEMCITDGVYCGVMSWGS